jgi:hypothetical protein
MQLAVMRGGEIVALLTRFMFEHGRIHTLSCLAFIPSCPAAPIFHRFHYHSSSILPSAYPHRRRAAKSGLRQAPLVVAELLAVRPQPARVDLQNRHFQTALMMAVCLRVCVFL